ncbi:Nop domain-containing protein [Russula emetica]|nr:Nop domain-containing protein [Russula emetica]
MQVHDASVIRDCNGLCLFKPTTRRNSPDPDLYKGFETRIYCTLKLKYLHRFTSTATAVEQITTMQEGKLGKGLKEFLNKVIVEKGKNKEELVVNAFPSLWVKVISDINTLELFRGIRSQLTTPLNPKDLATMSLGLSHSLSRFKLKLSPDKVDTMIVQAIALFDDIDKEYHVIVASFLLLTALAGFRTNAATTDFAAILPEELEATIKAGAEISMGTEISESDLAHIHALCDQVISISDICAIAPNLTALVGELVGTRLISHAGSLLNLAKHLASTVQIFGAENALFRALKTKHDTPKYGLIYHVEGQATKSALSVRVDALTDADEKSTPSAPTIGLENHAKLVARLRSLEAESDATGKRIKLDPAASTYNPATDAVGLVSTQREPIEEAVKAVFDVKEEKRCAKRRAEKEKVAAAQEEKPDAAAVDGEADAMEVDGEEKVDKKKAQAAEERNHILGGSGRRLLQWRVLRRKLGKPAKKAEKAAIAQDGRGKSSSKKKKKHLKSEK